MTQVEFVDRYSATGRTPPNAWTGCKGRCEGMGCYPMDFGRWQDSGPRRPAIVPQQRSEPIPWGAHLWEPFPPPDGTLIVHCADCKGTGRRLRGKIGDALDSAYARYYAVWWPLWATWFEVRQGFNSSGSLPHRIYTAAKWLPYWRQFIKREMGL